MTEKLSNPKDLAGSNKLPLHMFPNTAVALGSLALFEGMCKYGRSNYRVVGVRASVYYDAVRRHMDAWFEGENIDDDSELPHLAKALACIAVLIDADAAGKLNDDRMYPGGYTSLVTRYAPLVAEIKARHADKSPQHYTIQEHGYGNKIDTAEAEVPEGIQRTSREREPSREEQRSAPGSDPLWKSSGW